jgi:hypothetical protein
MAQKEMQPFKVQVVGDFAELARLGNEVEADDEASSCSSREDI